MVKKQSMYWKNLWKNIGKTKARFLSIFAIVFLGASIFAGLRNTPGVMRESVDNYLDSYNFAELTYISTLGLSEEEIDAIKEIEGVDQISYGYQFDALTKVNDIQKGITVLTAEKFYKGMLDEPCIEEGRFPKEHDECLIDETMAKENQYKLNDTITIYNDYGEKEYKIVGLVKDVRYLSLATRGTNTLGDGSNSGFIEILNDENDFLAIPDSLYELREKDVLYTKVLVGVEGASSYNVFSEDFDTYVEDTNTKIKSMLSLKMSDLYETYSKEALEKYEEGYAQYEEGLKEYEEGKAIFEKQILEAKLMLTNAKIQVTEGESQYIAGQDMASEEISKMLDTLTTTNEELKSLANSLQIELNKVSEEELKDTKNLLETTIQQCAQLIETMQSLNIDTEDILYIKETLESARALLEAQDFIELQVQFKVVDTLLDRMYKEEAYAEVKDSILEIDKNVETLLNRVETYAEITYPSREEMTEMIKVIEELEAILNSTGSMEGIAQLTQAQSQIQKAKLLISQQENELTLQELTYKAQLEEAKKELDEAKLQLDEAKEQIKQIPKGKVYTLTRNENEGIVSFDMNINSIETIANVFPLLFFLVSALVSLTTMTRMVEEQRSMNGTLRALGYSKWDVMKQYIVYVLLATFFACVLGMVAGTELLPRIVCFLYFALMFSVKTNILITYSVSIGLQTIFISVFVTLFATLSVLINELNLMPAILMRPKAPKAGKRILLERINFIWKKLSFNYKVTMRNIFRYKKRFFMSVIGIAGCTGLIITGFGINYSVSQVVTMQYQNVYKYDAMVSLDEEQKILDARENEALILNRDEVSNVESVYNQSAILMKNKETVYGSIMVYQSMDNITNFISFNDYKNNEKIVLDDTGVVLTEKAARTMNVKAGDTIDVEFDGIKYNLKVSNIMENYVGNYIYMSQACYEELTQESLEVNKFLINMKSLSNSDKKSLEKYMLEKEYGQLTYTESQGSDFEEQMASLKIVIVILILAAGALNFIVLYNLTNINIQERKSEIATIKVLGFRSKEVYDYIFRENTILSIIGSALGTVFGFFIHRFIILTIDLEIAMFVEELRLSSYLIAIVITLIFTELINYSMRKVLDKIDMVESLKSIE